MKPQRPVPGGRKPAQPCRRGQRGVRWAVLVAMVAAFPILEVRPLLAITNSPSAEEVIPPLRPPRGELPPTFWEQHASAVVLGGVLVVVAIATGLWWALLPRPASPEPPAARARHELETLRQAPETGAVLSRVSAVLRHYFAAAFDLPDGEMTTTEFSRALAMNDRVGPDLSGAVSGFLRECDERKFAPSPPASSLEAVPRAARFIDLAETRRARLAAVNASEVVKPPATPVTSPAQGS